MNGVFQKKHDYLASAAEEMEQELSVSIQRSLCAIEASCLVADCIELFDAITRYDMECNGNPELLSEEQWETYWDDIESFLAKQVSISQRVIALAEKLQATGETVARVAKLRDKVEHALGVLNWPEDYADTPKYRALAAEAERQYLAGECEEGGWDISEEELSESP